MLSPLQLLRGVGGAVFLLLLPRPRALGLDWTDVRGVGRWGGSSRGTGEGLGSFSVLRVRLTEQGELTS